MEKNTPLWEFLTRMTDAKTELLGTGAALFLIGIMGLASPIIPTTLAAIMQRDTVTLQFLFGMVVIIGAVLFIFGVKFRKK